MFLLNQNFENPRWQFCRPICFLQDHIKKLWYCLKTLALVSVWRLHDFCSFLLDHDLSLTSIAPDLRLPKTWNCVLRCQIDAREGTENLAALRVAVFLLFRKNHGGPKCPPNGVRVKPKFREMAIGSIKYQWQCQWRLCIRFSLVSGLRAIPSRDKKEET